MTFYAGLCFVGVAALSAIRAELVVESCAAADLRQPLTLKYWNGRGLMEIARMILAVGGKFPGDYLDGRYDAPAAGLESNLGRMPVINYGADSIAQILAISEHLRETNLAYRALVPYDQAPTRDETITWFEKGSTDVTGTADSSQRANRYMIWWMGRIENALGGDGFAVGSKMSLADIMLYYYFAEVLTDPESPAGFPLFKREPFGDIDRTQAAVARHPRIAASIAAVKANTNFQKWLTIHGPQEF